MITKLSKPLFGNIIEKLIIFSNPGLNLKI